MTWVVDGDTIEARLEDGSLAKVRPIGIGALRAFTLTNRGTRMPERMRAGSPRASFPKG